MSNSLEIIKRELRRWPNVDYTIEPSKVHPKVWLAYGEERRFLPFSSTKVQSRGLLNKVTELRRTLRDMGAQRDKH